MRTKSAFINVTAILIFQIALMISGFILPSLIISHYGSNINGLVNSLKQFISYINIVEMGIATAAITSLYQPLAEKNSKQINGILKSVKLLYIRSGILFCIGIIILAFMYPIIVNNQIGYNVPCVLTLIMGISGVTEYFFLGKYRVLLLADQKNYIISLTQAIATILNLAIVVILIKLNVSIIIVQIITAITIILRTIAILMFVKREYSYLDEKNVKSIKLEKTPFDVLIHQVAGIIINTMPILVLTIIGDLKLVSIYTIYYFVISSLKQVLSSFSSGVMSSFGNLIYKDKKKMVSIYSEFEYIYFIILFILFTCASILIIPFIALYSRKFCDANYVLPQLAFLFIVVGLLDCLRVPALTMVSAFGLFKETKWRAMLEAVLNTVFTIFFGMQYSINGVLLGSIISFGYRTIDFIIYNNSYILEKKHKSTFSRLVTNTILSICLIVIFRYIVPVKMESWTIWFVYAIILFLIVATIVITINALLYINDFKKVLKRFSTVLKRKN